MDENEFPAGSLMITKGGTIYLVLKMTPQNCFQSFLRRAFGVGRSWLLEQPLWLFGNGRRLA